MDWKSPVWKISKNKPQNDKSPQVLENTPDVQWGCREWAELRGQVWSLFVRVSNGVLGRGSAHVLKTPQRAACHRDPYHSLTLERNSFKKLRYFEDAMWQRFFCFVLFFKIYNISPESQDLLECNSHSLGDIFPQSTPQCYMNSAKVM